jgi:ribosomal protein S18 acetylase RimI-like enzyme
MDRLANPVWYALTGPQRHCAERRRAAVRFPSDVAPFCAVPDSPSPQDWHDLAELLAGREGALFREPVDLPGRWRRGESWPCLQMTLAQPAAHQPPGPPIVPLDRSDIPEMIDLVQRTRPGPFEPGTIATGRYVGIRIDGRLAAMAGERLRLPGATEVSAVCVDPAARRSKLARRLVCDVVAGIQKRGDLPFLHVVADNSAAIRLYRGLGFATARRVEAVVISAA